MPKRRRAHVPLITRREHVAASLGAVCGMLAMATAALGVVIGHG